MNKPLVSIIVPCYNEEQTIPIFYKALTQTLEKAKFNADLEIIFVNDGSRDKTLTLIKNLQTQDPKRVHYISFSRNFGKEGAMLAGMRFCHGDYATIMDADLQDPPEILPKMLALLQDPNNDYDVIATRRADRKHENIIRSKMSHAFYKVINHISEIKLTPDERDFRLMKRKVINAFLELPEYDRFTKGIFAWIGFNVKYLSYPDHKRVAGKSKFSIWALIKMALGGILNFSQVALDIASWIGFIFCLLAFVAIIWLIVRKCLDPSIALRGWTSLASLILLVSGVQLFCIGIIGKYLGKMYDQTKHRPNYIISEKK